MDLLDFLGTFLRKETSGYREQGEREECSLDI